MQRRALGMLFGLIALGLAAVAFYAAVSGGRAWVIAVTAAALAAWMGDLAYKALWR